MFNFLKMWNTVVLCTAYMYMYIYIYIYNISPFFYFVVVVTSAVISHSQSVIGYMMRVQRHHIFFGMG